MKKDSEDFKEAIKKFATGVCVVTTESDGEVNGMTATAISSLSVTPPQVIVCIDKKNHSHSLIKKSSVFAINVLSVNQKESSNIFATPGKAKAEHLLSLETITGPTGSPIIKDSIAFLDCKLISIHDSGDHSIFIGEVVGSGTLSNDPPLLYFNGDYNSLAGP